MKKKNKQNTYNISDHTITANLRVLWNLELSPKPPRVKDVLVAVDMYTWLNKC